MSRRRRIIIIHSGVVGEITEEAGTGVDTRISVEYDDKELNSSEVNDMLKAAVDACQLVT